MAFFGMMTVVCAVSRSPGEFIAWRFLSGAGFGAAFPVATAMMGEWMPRRAAGKAISVMTIGIPIGIMVGALAASWLLPQLGWRDCFAGTGALCIALALVLLYSLPESPVYLDFKGRVDAVNAVLSKAWGRGVVVGAAAGRGEGRQPGAQRLLARANRRLNVGLWLGVLFNSFATYAIGGWLTVILVDLKLPLAVALRGPLTVSMSAIAGALAAGWLVARLGSRLAMLGLACVAVACAAAMSLGTFALPTGAALWSVVFAGLALGGFSAGALQPSFYVLAASAYGTPVRSKGIGMAAVMGRVGAISSSFAGGAALALVNASGFFMLVALLGAGCVAGVLVIDRHTPASGRARRADAGPQEAAVLAK